MNGLAQTCGNGQPPPQQSPAAIESFPACRKDTEELNRLPEKYRAPLILCHLQGKSTEQAAQHVGCPRGTILSRLARARDLLRRRLTRRGLAVTAIVLETALAQNGLASVSPSLFEATVKTGTFVLAGECSATPAMALADAVTKGMFMMKLKVLGAMGLLLTVVVVGLALGVARPPEMPEPTPPPATAFTINPIEPVPRDPLPPTDCTIHLWETESGQLIRTTKLEGRQAPHVRALAFSPDGRMLLSGTGDGVARLWDVQSGEKLREFTGKGFSFHGMSVNRYQQPMC